MNIQLIQFAEAKQPQYAEKKGEGYIMYGDRKCKIKLPSDWWLNVAARDNNFKVYWA